MDLSATAEQFKTLRTIRVSRGLFVLRYVSSRAGLNAPTISVATPSNSGVVLISPADGEARLVSPGDGLVVRASRDSIINVSVQPTQLHGSCDAELVLERVSTTMREQHAAIVDNAFIEPLLALQTADIQLLAHVARRGDLLVKAGEWICGPQLPMAIEGIEIRWNNRPQGIDIISRATINARGLRTLPECSIGSFLGSRGRAAPITSLTFTLQGPDDYDLVCDAAFLGLAVQSIRGKSVHLTGLTGLEPLVGLRLSFVADLGKTQVVHRGKAIASAPLPQTEAAHPENPSRVRIFRSAGGRASPAVASRP